jgi:hypothetical protein
MFKPVKLFFRFLFSPYLWVTGGVLSIITAAATILYRRPARGWQTRQAAHEVIAAGAFFCLAVIHRSLAKKPSVQQMRAFLRRWWTKYKRPVLVSVTVITTILLVFILIRWRSNVALAKEIRTEFDVWLATLPKVPDDENGMLVIMLGVETFGELPPEPMNCSWFNIANEEHRKALLDYLEPREQALEKVREGLKYKKFLFPADYSKGPAVEIPNLLGFKYAAQAFVWKGELAELENRKSDALKEYLNALRLAKALSEEPMVISRMIEIAASYIGIKPTTKMLSAGSVAESDLVEALRTLIELHGKSGDFYTIMETEHYCGLAYVAANIIEDKIDYEQLGYGDKLLSSIWFSKYIYNYRDDVEKSRKTLEICRKVDPASYRQLPPEVKDDDAFMEWIGVSSGEISLAALCLMHPNWCVDSFVEVEVLWRGAIALAAVRLFEVRNGRLPENLTELKGLVPKERLVDPFSGKHIIYRPAGDDFYLYSTGYDGVDGMPVKAVPFFEDEGDWRRGPDIIFHVPPTGENSK